MSRHLSIRVSDELFEKLYSISVYERVTLTAIVQTALEMFIEEYNSNKYDVSERLRKKISPITKPVSLAKSMKLKEVAELI